MVVDGDDDSSDDEDDDDDGEPSMMDNEAGSAEKMAVDEPKPSKPVPDADGWTTVPPRRGRGKNWKYRSKNLGKDFALAKTVCQEVLSVKFCSRFFSRDDYVVVSFTWTEL